MYFRKQTSERTSKVRVVHGDVRLGAQRRSARTKNLVRGRRSDWPYWTENSARNNNSGARPDSILQEKGRKEADKS